MRTNNTCNDKSVFLTETFFWTKWYRKGYKMKQQIKKANKSFDSFWNGAVINGNMTE